MRSNMGSIDKAIRILIAVIIGILYYMDILTGTAAIILLVLAGVFILTSFAGFCPLYWPFGISTRKKSA